MSQIVRSPLRVSLLCISLVFLLGAIFRTVQDNRMYPGGDLRYKIVGARLLVSGRNPYSAEYQQDPRFAMTLWRSNGPSQVTYDPALLLLYSPFCWANYGQLRHGWFFVEWGCLLASIGLLFRSIALSERRHLFLCVATLGFAASHFWRLHIDRGQYYVYILLLLSLSWFLKSAFSGDAFFFTIPLAMATAFRPTFGVIGIALLLFWQWRSALCYFAFVAIFVGCTMPFGGIQRWQQFFANASDIARGMGDSAFLDKKFGTQTPGPVTAEGVAFTRELEIETTNSSYGSYAYRGLSKLHIVPKNAEMAASERPAQIAILLVLAAAAVPISLYRRYRPSGKTILFSCITIALISDLFVPIRFSYVDIIFLLPVGAILGDEKRGWLTILSMLLIGLGLLMGSGFENFMDARHYLVLRPSLIVAGCVVKVFADLTADAQTYSASIIVDKEIHPVEPVAAVEPVAS